MPLIPTNMTELIDLLKSNGYRNLKRESGVQVRVLIDGNDRQRKEKCVLITERFKKIGARYDPDHRDSSIGAVIINKMRINVKPLSKQGSSSAGVENETYIVDQINNIIKDVGNPKGIRVQFKKGTRKKTYKNIVKCLRVGADTKGRKKADIALVNKTGKKYPLSLKKDNYDILESADSYYRDKARKKIDKLVKSGKVAIEFFKYKNRASGRYAVYKIVPNFAIRATSKEMRDVIFGSDILRDKGAVLVRTFAASDFSYDGKSNLLTITVSDLIAEMIHAKSVWFLVRNDSGRNVSSKYPDNPNDMPAGIRVLANTEDRIGGNVLRVR